jgi:hypothetical protein
MQRWHFCGGDLQNRDRRYLDSRHANLEGRFWEAMEHAVFEPGEGAYSSGPGGREKPPPRGEWETDMKDKAYEKPVLIVLDDGYKTAGGACNAGGLFGCSTGTSYISGICNTGYAANTTCGTGYAPGGVTCYSGAAADCDCHTGYDASGAKACGGKCTCGAKEGTKDCGYGYGATPNQCCTGEIAMSCTTGSSP